MTLWPADPEAPLSVTKYDDFGAVCKAMQHAHSEGMGIQVWSFRRAGDQEGQQAWTVEIYVDTPVVWEG